MAPNLIGNTFLLAETTLDPEPIKRTASVSASNCPNNNNNNSNIKNLNDSNNNSYETIQKPKITKQSLEINAAESIKTTKPYQLEIVWRNVYAFVVLHGFALYGLYIMCTESVLYEYLWCHLIGLCGGFGITAGAHRLWAHKAYKAKWQLRVILMAFQTIAFQNSIYEWVRDHRVHHKFCDSHADPHNSKRGFFFSHMGWLMCKKHPDVRAKGKAIDMSDLEADPIVMFQKRHYMKLMPLFCFVLPSSVPFFVMGTSLRVCFFVCSIFRYVISLHCTWLVNSAAHFYGMKPYDKHISPSNNKFVAIAAYGEGWHNYHHVFPWDYKTAELGDYSFNFTTAFIDFFYKIGWAYDLKTVSGDMIRKRIARTGDGSHDISKEDKKMDELVMELHDKVNHENLETLIWGWDDKDLAETDREGAQILNKDE